ncbi:MAG: right-handed parallel beta-helix repeat-containing protein, partial [Paludibacteraceae bacterium]|nr:right-handed parallel beta-helix repeat-containing protein [Paludibacteraceae bacterium]
SSVVVDGFTIQNGTADNGGGAYLRKNTTVSNCIIRNNKASKYGSAIYASSAVIKNCQIICNAYLNYLYYTVRLSNCVMDSCVVKNNKSYYYGAIYAESNSQISNCEIEGNGSAYYNNGYRGSYFNATKINNCKFVNTNGAGACVELANSSVMSRCLFEGNVNVDTHVISINGNSLAEDCQILSNKTTSNVLYLYNGKINRCTINGNTTSARILSMNYSSSSATNCLICNNNCSSTSYEPIYMYDRAVISNCTFVNNETKHGNFLYMYNSTLKNSILVGNKTNGNHSGFFNLGGTNTIKNNMLEATFVDGNIDGSMAYAAFTDAENGDYSLSANSYCINAGEEVSDSLDLYGKARKQGGAVDMGAIESAYTKSPVLQKCGDIIYVKSGSKGDGTSWTSAFGDIQQAIFAASADGKKHQIWVAAGTYYGDTTLSTVVNLAPGISLYGGFAGTETSLAARDTAKNPTIIDGKNQRRVITQNYGFADSMAVVVDGFTIQNGTAAEGGGVNITANTTINNCIIKNNKASENGSAIYATSATIKNCQIVENTYTNRLYYTVRLNKCMMDSCVLRNNKTYYNSVIYAESNSNVTNCEIEGNSSYNNNIGSYFNSSKISNCKFVKTSGAGAGVELRNASVIRDCQFEGNTNVNNQIIYAVDDNVLIEDCKIRNNTSTRNSFIYLSNSKINRCQITDNTVSSNVIESYNSKAKISNCLICDNTCPESYRTIYIY